MSLLLAAAATLALSGLPAYLFPARSAWGQRLGAGLMLAGSALGLAGIVLAWGAGGPAIGLDLPWFLPYGRFAVGLDALGAVFLVPVFVVPALAAVYGLGYWRAADHPDDGRRVGLFLGLLAATMALVVLARDGVLFLVAWEIMALSAYFAAAAESKVPAVREAGWVYLIATHIGTMLLMAMFALWRSATGSFGLAPAALPTAAASAVFVLALLGFGFKAGLMPLHFWLPGAHSNAPSHISAVMSGVMLKMGVYGIVRLSALAAAAPPAWWGGALLAAGAASALAGVACAVGQADIKRLLAYSSIENVGVILMGVGLALLGRAAGRADWILLGLGAALFHVWNHGLFKPLLFFASGAVIHASGTRDIEGLGGLAKTMPRTAVLFALGAVAACGLPPLNGFVGEWLLYLGLFRTLDPAGAAGAAGGAGFAGAAGAAGYAGAAAAAAALAMAGALAVAAFVKLYGAVFLGTARVPEARRAHDPAAPMLAAMGVLAALGLAVAGAPALALRPIETAAASWLAGAGPAVADLAPLGALGWAAVGLAGAAGVLYLLARRGSAGRAAAAGPTWDCGYAEPTARMQYTGSSFGASAGGLFRFLFLPKHDRPNIRGPFPAPSRFAAAAPDPAWERLFAPLARLAGDLAPRLRFLQQGQTHLYVLYILIFLILMLLGGGVL
jgi:hydrogenase-4 component B